MDVVSFGKMKRLPIILLIVVLLGTTLACRAATRLIYADTPAPPAPPLPTASPLPPTPSAVAPTPGPTPGVSCPAEMSSILAASKYGISSNPNFPVVDTGNQVDIPLLDYTVSADQIINPIVLRAPKDLRQYQSDHALQHKAWDLFTQLIPADQRKEVREYQIITDGPGGVLGAVEQTPGDPNYWMLEVDIADVGDTKNLVFTLLHEFGHLLTLEASQVPPDLKIFNNPQDNNLYNAEANACSTYFPGEGCSLEKSYINTFYNRFWTDIFDEWLRIDNIQNDQRRLARLEAFYSKYRDQFVDDYAVTNTNEDIAETWAYFVLSPKPDGHTIAEQKLQFFYQYPELTQLRDQILESLCTTNP
jgi:hypothetical protein